MSATDSALSPGRLVLVGVAAVALLVGLTASDVLAPLGAAIEAVVERVGTDYVVAAVLGGLALLTGLVVFASGRGAAMAGTEMPTVERPVPVPAAGERFDGAIGSLRFAAGLADGNRDVAVRDRLRTAAVAALAADEGCSRETARQRVAAGRWTADDHAAAFLAGEATPLSTWVTALPRGQTGPEYRARRTVAAIVARHDSDEPSGAVHAVDGEPAGAPGAVDRSRDGPTEDPGADPTADSADGPTADSGDDSTDRTPHRDDGRGPHRDRERAASRGDEATATRGSNPGVHGHADPADAAIHEEGRDG